jgi:N utilization substance protein A
VDDENKQATVIVPDDQLSLAIGKEGQNARLAARLTGWRVDIRSETEFAEEEAEMGYEEEEVSGRCAAILTSGRRCPNAALPGSRYCGLPAHQELAAKGTDYVGGEPPEGSGADEGPDDGDTGQQATPPEGQAGAEDEVEAPADAVAENGGEPEAEEEAEQQPAGSGEGAA